MNLADGDDHLPEDNNKKCYCLQFDTNEMLPPLMSFHHPLTENKSNRNCFRFQQISVNSAKAFEVYSSALTSLHHKYEMGNID